MKYTISRYNTGKKKTVINDIFFSMSQKVNETMQISSIPQCLTGRHTEGESTKAIIIAEESSDNTIFYVKCSRRNLKRRSEF
jgi:hypothetical protein